MSYRSILILLGLSLIVWGLIEQGWQLVAAWLGCNFVLLGIAHSRGLHRVFGKRPDGTLPLLHVLLFLPILLAAVIVWHLLRFLRRESAWNIVNQNLVVGRRLFPSELEGEFVNIVDLTAEFQEPKELRRLPGYISFPILDGAAPSADALGAFVRQLPPGKTFIHCAEGHGRTGLVALAILLESGIAQSIEDGLEILTAARPGVRLSQAQYECIRELAASLRNSEPATPIH